MAAMKVQNNQQQLWYIYINQETRGPFALRDLDVLLRTNEINSRTFGWKSEMKEWKPLNQIEELKNSILQSSNQLLEIERKKGNIVHPQKIENQEKNPGEDQLIENKDEDPLEILEVTVQNLLKKSFNQSQDGKWSIFDEQKGQWVLQDEEPIEQINQMKNFLFNKLKNQLFFDDKGKKKNKHTESLENLTKQELEKKEKNRKKSKRAAQKKKEKWYKPKINTYIYISGLPLDVTQDEVKEFVSKAGVLRIDLNAGKQKLKLYKDQNDFPKGDAVASYARQQSVDLAVQILNGRDIRQGFPVHVQRAQFSQKQNEYRTRQLKKANKVKKKIAKKNEEKLLAWDDGIEEKGEGFRIVIIKHIFTPELLYNDNQIEEIKEEFKQEIMTMGQVKRIKFYEDHPDGVVEIKFEKENDAQKCISIMNGRYFDGRLLVCEYWDGETDYKRDAASQALQQERLEKYAEILQGQQNNHNEIKDHENAQKLQENEKQKAQNKQTD